MKPCTLGKRHKWRFSHNICKQRGNGQIIHLSSRGIYRCDCGQRKEGPSV